jgi:SAM-dependent methyltransferase
MPTADEDGRVPTAVDTTVPSIARVYDAVLGGKDNYAADQKVRDGLLAAAPEIQAMAIDNREWLIRVVSYLASPVRGPGLDQILDCGSGLPTAENTHDAAHRVNPEARVVYVDNDPVVIAHGRALLEDDRNTRFVAADFTEPEKVLADHTTSGHLDLTRPVGVLLVGVLHHVSDEQDAPDIVRRYLDLLPAGSYVAISHFLNPADGSRLADLATRLEEVFLHGAESGRFRTHDEIRAMFGDLEMLDPGLSLLAQWWPDGPRTVPLRDVERLIVGGVARKP